MTSLEKSNIITEFEDKNSDRCRFCKETMLGRNCIQKPQCLNPDCFKNNDNTHFCVCEHRHDSHENIFGVCMIKNCLCAGYDFLCTFEVMRAWSK